MDKIIERIVYPLVLGFVFGGILGSCSRSDRETRGPSTGKMVESGTKTKMGENISNRLEDTWLHAQIVSKLITNPATPQRNITVDVVDRVVTLRGVVESEEQKNVAERIANETQGVKKVSNQLKIVKQRAGGPSVSRSLIGMLLAAAAGKK